MRSLSHKTIKNLIQDYLIPFKNFQCYLLEFSPIFSLLPPDPKVAKWSWPNPCLITTYFRDDLYEEYLKKRKMKATGVNITAIKRKKAKGGLAMTPQHGG